MQRNQRSNCQYPLDHRKREFQKNIYFCLIYYAKAFDCVDHDKLWKILKEMGIPDHVTCLLRNLYAGQEAKVRTGHGTTDWFQIRKGVRQGYISSPRLVNLYAEYIIWWLSGLDSKASVYNVGDQGSIPGWGRSPGKGNGHPLQYSCPENPMDGGA